MASEQLVNMRFVREVQKYPHLYNFNLPEYSRKDLTAQAWGKVAQAVRLSENECKDKWKNLRSVFSRHMRSTKTKRVYYLADAMNFCRPFIKTIRSRQNHDNDQTTASDKQQSTKEEAQDHQDDDPLIWELPPQLASTTFPYSAPSPQQSRSPSPLNIEEPTNSNRKESEEIDDVFLGYFKAKKAKMESTKDVTLESKRMFLLSLLPDLDAMNDAQMRMFRRKVVQLMDELFEDSNTNNYS